MAQLSAQAAQSSSVNFIQLPDLRQPGTFNFRKETFTLTDSVRQRTFYVILYLPKTWRTGKTPVALLSHGLGSRPEDFESVAEHLASYGYVVAIPQHPGSDTQRKQALFKGFSREVFDIDDFLERPKDISAVIDELERRNQTEFGGRLDLENVGVAGHSFGAYTALAVAGAEINFDYLESVCDRPFRGLNISLFLQCRALSLPRQTYQFRDSRVKAVLAKNPFYSGIFGQKGLAPIQIPVAIVGGKFDPATPFVLEQVSAFTWLTTPNKYLGLKEGQAHVNLSQLDAGITQGLEALPQLELAESELLDSYLNPMIVAFFEVHIANNAQFRPYLTSAYGEYLSQNQPFKFYWIDSSSQPALLQAKEDF
jgi:predicted dienelactone hydrolase